MEQEIFMICQQEEENYKEFWQSIVNIDSGSDDIDGLQQVGQKVISELEKNGVIVEKIPHESNDSFHVKGMLKGKGKRKFLFIAHMDTVFKKGTAVERPFFIDEDWAYGPGVSDCKGGLSLAIFSSKLLQKLNINNFGQITYLFNCDEEISSTDSRRHIQAEAAKSDYVFVFEPGGIGDAVTQARKGTAKLHIEVEGISTHSGSNPYDGANALMELSYQLSKLGDLYDRKKKTSCVFTKMKSGEKMNVVPDYAEAWADVRVMDLAELDRLEKDITKILAEKRDEKTTVKYELIRQKPPFATSKETANLVKLCQSIYNELGRNLGAVSVGGASDAKWAALKCKAVIDSLGPVKGGANHTVHERTQISSIVPRMYLLTNLVKRLS